MEYKLTIGFITCGEYSLKYLPIFLSSIFDQKFVDFNILAVDCSENSDGNLKILKKYPEIKIVHTGNNLGFARAHNIMIARAKEWGSEYYLALNPDMKFGPSFIKELVAVMDRDAELGSVSPKILKWDFKNNRKTNIIDTLGIQMLSGLRFFDIAQDKKDHPVNSFYLQKGDREGIDIFGPSGAAAMYRMSALEKVRDGNGYFDELMFMYKEDADLAYRLFLAGFRSKCITGSVIYHDRTASGLGSGNLAIIKNRKNKNKQCKKWSFLHQNIIFIKYWRLQNLQNKLAIIWYELKMIIYALLFERYLLGEFIHLWKLRKRIERY